MVKQLFLFDLNPNTTNSGWRSPTSAKRLLRQSSGREWLPGEDGPPLIGGEGKPRIIRAPGNYDPHPAGAREDQVEKLREHGH